MAQISKSYQGWLAPKTSSIELVMMNVHCMNFEDDKTQWNMNTIAQANTIDMRIFSAKMLWQIIFVHFYSTLDGISRILDRWVNGSLLNANRIRETNQIFCETSLRGQEYNTRLIIHVKPHTLRRPGVTCWNLRTQSK